MAKPLALVVTGASGTYLYNNKDILSDYMNDGTRGVLHSLTAPSRPNSSPSQTQDVRQLQNMVSTLTHQIDKVAANQRDSHHIIVSATQPSTIFGIATWKAVGTAAIVAMVCFKAKGYHMADLVYVSKRHFNTVADGLKKQYDMLDQTIAAVKADLMARVAALHTKVDESHDSITNKIDTDVGKVSDQIQAVASSLEKVDTCVAQTSHDIKEVASDMAHVRSDIKLVHTKVEQGLDRLGADMNELRESTSASNDNMQRDVNKIDSKIEDLSRMTNAKLNHMQVGMDRQTKGIQLLCQFVHNSHEANSGAVSRDANASLLAELDMFTRDQGALDKNAQMKRRSSGLTGFRTITAGN